MKKHLFVFCLVASQLGAQTTTFDNLNANYGSNKKITWFTSNYSSGFGHRIINSDPGGQTLLSFQARNNTSIWSDVMKITSLGNVGIGITGLPAQRLEVGGNILSTSSNPYISIYGHGTGAYQGATLRLNSMGVSSGNEHASAWLINHRGTDGVGTFELQRRNSSGTYRGSLLFYRDNYGWDFRTATSTTTTGTGTRLTIKNTGEVGIGITDPQEKLHVSGNILGNKLILNDPNDTSDWNTLWQSGFYQGYNATNAPEASAWFWGLNMNHSSNNSTYKYNGQIAIKNSSINPVMYFRSTNADGIGTWTKVLHSEGNQTINGNLGIGTTNTQGFKLGVDGDIAALEVKIATYTNWADFVFNKDYDLPTLQEVEKHIKEKGHLKNIPNAKEVKKDGFYLAEMNAKLLQKVEELTLYTINQEKELQDQKRINEGFEKDLKELKEENQVLKSLLERVKKLEENIKK